MLSPPRAAADGHCRSTPPLPQIGFVLLLDCCCEMMAVLMMMVVVEVVEVEG
jgi:hypothetical protein